MRVWQEETVKPAVLSDTKQSDSCLGVMHDASTMPVYPQKLLLHGNGVSSFATLKLS